MAKYIKRFIHWTDPDYLNAFYKGWGSGQSVTHRQAPRSEDHPERHQKQPEPQQEQDPS
jgi:hypothetical protein